MQLGYEKHLWLNLWSSSERERDGSEMDHPIHLLQQPVAHRHPTCPEYLKATSRIKEVKAQNHYRESTKIKRYMKRRSYLWFYFCFPPEKSQTQVTGCLMTCLLGLYFEDVSVMCL